MKSSNELCQISADDIELMPKSIKSFKISDSNHTSLIIDLHAGTDFSVAILPLSSNSSKVVPYKVSINKFGYLQKNIMTSEGGSIQLVCSRYTIVKAPGDFVVEMTANGQTIRKALARDSGFEVTESEIR